MLHENLHELENTIGYVFQNKDYLKKAMTHTSYANELGVAHHHLLSNEQLEFLGDSVLQTISSDYLYENHPEMTEGDLTRIRSLLVCEEALSSYAKQIHLGDYLLLGRGEASDGRTKPAILCDAFEALLAAMFLDCGRLEGMTRIREFLLPFLTQKESELDTMELPVASSNPKSYLQEFLAKDNSTLKLSYRLAGETGPDHCKMFTVEVWMDGNRIGVGRGASKKKAEQEAARDALHLFGMKNI